MSVSADLLRLGLVREATPGVLPANPAYQLLRVTSESLAYQPSTQQSNELNSSRQTVDIIVTGGQSGGDIAFEVSSNPGFEMMLEGVLCNAWTADALTVGGMLLTHGIEKRFTIDPEAVDVTKQYDYHRIARAIVDSMTLTFTPGGPGTGTASILGGAYTRDNNEIAGATFIPAGYLPVMVGSGVLPIIFTIDGVDYTGWCLSNLVVNFRNNGRAIACLGQDSASEVVLGRFECEVTGDIYLNAEARAVTDAFLNNDEIEFEFTVEDAEGNTYRFEFTRVRVSAATTLATGTNQDVIINTTLQALVDTVGTAPDEKITCVTVTRTHVTSPWPMGV